MVHPRLPAVVVGGADIEARHGKYRTVVRLTGKVPARYAHLGKEVDVSSPWQGHVAPGTKGYIQYRVNARSGLWYFESNKGV